MMTRLLLTARRYPFSVFCFCCIWVLSLTPYFPETPLDDVRFVDKWVHMVMYGGACLVLWAEYLRQHRRADRGRLFVWAWAAPILMGGLLELLQSWCTVSRTGDWLDVAANATGVTLAALAGATSLLLRRGR